MADPRTRRWHKAPNRLRDGAYMMLSAASRGVLAGLEELLADEKAITANVTVWARWLGLDRRIIREAFEAIGALGILRITSEARGKEGTFYTVATPDQTQTRPEADTKQTQSSTEADPNHVPDKSSKNAASQDSSLYRVEENRVEESRVDNSVAPKPKAARGARRKLEYSEDEEAFWLLKPEAWEEKEVTIKRARKAVADGATWEDLGAALERWKLSSKWMDGYVHGPRRWFDEGLYKTVPMDRKPIALASVKPPPLETAVDKYAW